MGLWIELPSRAEQHAANVAAWEALVADDSLPDGYRIETDRFGHLRMSPPPGFNHSSYYVPIAATLRELMGDRVLIEAGVSTSDGVRVADVAWMPEEVARGNEGKALADDPPHICIEIASPGNRRAELEHKRRLYFDAGTQEVWFCGEDGAMEFFLGETPEQPSSQSRLCPGFPSLVRL